MRVNAPISGQAGHNQQHPREQSGHQAKFIAVMTTAMRGQNGGSSHNPEPPAKTPQEPISAQATPTITTTPDGDTFERSAGAYNPQQTAGVYGPGNGLSVVVTRFGQNFTGGNVGK